MEWQSAYEYEKFKVPELKEQLKQRKLRSGGTKGVLIARLKAYDDEQ